LRALPPVASLIAARRQLSIATRRPRHGKGKEEFLMKKNDSQANENGASNKECQRSGHFRVWPVLGGMALVAAGVVLVRSLPDIKRYIKISTM
jgi:hypothetical protein